MLTETAEPWISANKVVVFMHDILKAIFLLFCTNVRLEDKLSLISGVRFLLATLDSALGNGGTTFI